MSRFSLSLVCLILSVEPGTVSRYSLQTHKLRGLSLHLVAERPRQGLQLGRSASREVTRALQAEPRVESRERQARPHRLGALPLSSVPASLHAQPLREGERK